MAMHNPPHPGEVLKEALAGLEASVTDFAAHIGVSRVQLTRVLQGQSGVSPAMSIRLSQAFGQTPDLWFKMQNAYDFWQAARKSKIAVKLLSAAA